MVDFVRLQQDAARHLESHAPAARVASVWPFTGAISRPEFGYVHRPVPSVVLRSFDVADLARANRRDYDLLVVYSRSWSLASVLDEIAVLRPLLRRRLYTPEPSADEIRASLGLVPLERWQRGWQWIAIYGPAR
jgi:hypothetical protein